MQYRKPDIIQNEIQETKSIIIEINRYIQKYPDDNALHTTLKQETKQLELLTAEFKESLVYYRHSVVECAFEREDGQLPLSVLSEVMSSMQELINQTASFMFGKKRQTVPLYLRTTYHGSFGLLLSSDRNAKLLNNKQEESLETVFLIIDKMLNCDSQGLHKLVSDELKGSKKLANKYAKLFDSISNSQNNVKLTYSSDNKSHYSKITHSRSAQLRDKLIEKTSEKTVKTFECVVKGVSLLSHRIELLTTQNQNTTKINAQYDKKMDDIVKNTLDKQVVAMFELVTEYNEATDSEIKLWKMLEIELKK